MHACVRKPRVSGQVGSTAVSPTAGGRPPPRHHQCLPPFLLLHCPKCLEAGYGNKNEMKCSSGGKARNGEIICVFFLGNERGILDSLYHVPHAPTSQLPAYQPHIDPRPPPRITRPSQLPVSPPSRTPPTPRIPPRNLRNLRELLLGPICPGRNRLIPLPPSPGCSPYDEGWGGFLRWKKESTQLNSTKLEWGNRRYAR